MRKAAKVTISLPADVLRVTDRMAQVEDKPRSGIIREALAFYVKERERQEMIRGYQEMAALNQELTKEAGAAINEVWAEYG